MTMGDPRIATGRRLQETGKSYLTWRYDMRGLDDVFLRAGVKHGTRAEEEIIILKDALSNAGPEFGKKIPKVCVDCSNCKFEQQIQRRPVDMSLEVTTMLSCTARDKVCPDGYDTQRKMWRQASASPFGIAIFDPRGARLDYKLETPESNPNGNMTASEIETRDRKLEMAAFAGEMIHGADGSSMTITADGMSIADPSGKVRVRLGTWTGMGLPLDESFAKSTTMIAEEVEAMKAMTAEEIRRKVDAAQAAQAEYEEELRLRAEEKIKNDTPDTPTDNIGAW